MSGQNGPDEAARLETALARIARAASARQKRAEAAEHRAAQPSTDPAAQHANGAVTTALAGRLDSLIAELREVLGTPPL
jgi:hypothetical protein